jgi:hypothetical protein
MSRDGAPQVAAFAGIPGLSRAENTLPYGLSMIFSENRYPLFRIML